MPKPQIIPVAKSLISEVASGGIFGLGPEGYILAIISLEKLLRNENW